MTKTEQLSGRELDAAVAEEVMGRKGPFQRHDFLLLPYYSTDIAAAWLVREKLVDLGWGIALSDMRHSPNMDDPAWWWELDRYDRDEDTVVEDDEGNEHVIPTHYYKLDGSAPTAPEAICRAALAAVRAK